MKNQSLVHEICFQPSSDQRGCCWPPKQKAMILKPEVAMREFSRPDMQFIRSGILHQRMSHSLDAEAPVLNFQYYAFCTPLDNK
ncbi:hypothetical protein TNIN_490731 [Trichonephila inaurata madagascariensis]|uniref:Uncharacterized protein n=1 Tax=Trichonephila inaurata madagascariensis TaxID=2747483 RepID=A0A8X7CMJ5_9ARAC|nr:hypothetical protein TNIN_490731 [Trichonephila inaurata madagascariensis]